MIATHPEAERRVLAELDALGLLVTPARPQPRQLEYEDVGKLSYLNNCIKASHSAEAGADLCSPALATCDNTVLYIPVSKTTA